MYLLISECIHISHSCSICHFDPNLMENWPIALAVINYWSKNGKQTFFKRIIFCHLLISKFSKMNFVILSSFCQIKIVFQHFVRYPFISNCPDMIKLVKIANFDRFLILCEPWLLSNEANCRANTADIMTFI